MTPLILRPLILTIKNRFKGKTRLIRESGRDLFLIAFSLFVSFGIYWGSCWVLSQVNENPSLAFIPPSSILGLIFMMLSLMLLISALLAAIGALFLGEDLDLVLATPLPFRRFFYGKLVYVLLFSCWMPFVFAFPLLAAFGSTYGADNVFYLISVAGLLPLFTITSCVGLTLAVLVVSLIPVYRVRETILAILVCLTVALYLVIEVLQIEWSALRSSEEVLRLLSLVSAPQLAWLPSFWLAALLEEFLKPASGIWVEYLLMLFLAATASFSAAYLITLTLHDRAYSNIRNKRHGASTASARSVRKAFEFLSPFMSSHVRALVGKDLRIIARDVSQAVQLFILLGIALIYLYHLRVFSAVDTFPDHIRPWWKNFLFMGNVAMGAFVTTAICTRFVFPSVSLEGRSFWVLQTSPIKLSEILRAKFWCWFVPLAFIIGGFFAAGAVVIGADEVIVAASAISSVVVCYGIVGLAVGYGAVFAYFDWEHSSQLAGSLGGLIFMLSAVVLIFVNMLPTWILLFYRQHAVDVGIRVPILLVVNSTSIVLLNWYAAHFAMKRGAAALTKRYS